MIHSKMMEQHYNNMENVVKTVASSTVGIQIFRQVEKGTDPSDPQLTMSQLTRWNSCPSCCNECQNKQSKNL